MQRFQIEISKDETYTSHSGVALVGLAVNRFTKLVPALAKAAPLQAGGIPHADVVRSYLGVLSLGKTDYQAVMQHQADAFFKKSLNLARVPSEPTLRQRFDEHAAAFMAPVTGEAQEDSPRNQGKGTKTVRLTKNGAYRTNRAATFYRKSSHQVRKRLSVEHKPSPFNERSRI